jgi:pyruvate dehydrogenase (quinone)
MAKVAEVLVQTLIEAGVKRVYGVAGDSLNGMTETIRKSDKIEWLRVRHEEVAAFARNSTAPSRHHLNDFLFRIPLLLGIQLEC